MEHEQSTAPAKTDETTQTNPAPAAEAAQAVAQQAVTVQKKVSHTPSITGIVLAVLSLLLSAIGKALVHAKSSAHVSSTDGIDKKVGYAVDNGTTHVLGAIFGVPFLVGGITLALISALLLALRLRKIRTAGIIFTALAVLILIWSFSLAIGGFDYIRAKPAN